MLFGVINEVKFWNIAEKMLYVIDLKVYSFKGAIRSPVSPEKFGEFTIRVQIIGTVK